MNIIVIGANGQLSNCIRYTFARTNVMGSLALLQAAKEYGEALPEKYDGRRFYHISTDEVYDALEQTDSEWCSDGLITYVTDRLGTICANTRKCIKKPLIKTNNG